MPTKPCKPGKTRTGKNGRCVKSKAKTCKKGKTPTGKNGRCVKRDVAVRKQIKDYMKNMGDNKLFTKSEIDHMVKVAVDENLTKSDIDEGMDQFHKSYGVFA